jgi:hypothetical protein
MSSPSRIANPWGRETDFHGAFGSLAPFLEEIRMQPGFTSTKTYDHVGNDPFIRKMREVDAVLAQKRALKKKIVLEQLQHETAGLFLNQKKDVVKLCTEIKNILQLFLEYERRANIPLCEGSFSLSLTKSNQGAILCLLRCAEQSVSSSCTISSSPSKSNDNLVSSVISNLEQWHREISEVALYINTLLQFDSAFEQHCMLLRS